MLKLSNFSHKVYYKAPTLFKSIGGTLYSIYSNQYKYGKHYNNFYNFLKKSQWFSIDELENYRHKQLKEFIFFAVSRTKYYSNYDIKKYYENCQDQSLEIIKHYPIINKSIVRDNFDLINSNISYSKKLIFSSSGTTGTSIHIPVTTETLQREYAFRWIYQAVAGAKRGDKFAFFTGHDIFPVGKNKPPYWIHNYFENSIFFSLYHMSYENLKYYLVKFNKFRPQYIQGYPSGIYIFAKFIKENNFSIYSPLAIYSASETLHDYQKEIIEEVFNTKIFQWYGQVETTVNLHQCEFENFHVKEEYGLLELLNDDGKDVLPGEIGNVVGTGWGNYAFPLIRYNTGDVMRLAQNQICKCGRGGRLIDKIYGRDEDFIITPEGRYIGRLDFVFKPVDTVKESQIVQEDLNNIRINVVPDHRYSINDEELIIKKLQERIGYSMNIRVCKVDFIHRSKNGKIRYVISNVKI